MLNVNDLSITSFETIMACGINGGAFRFLLDEMQNCTIGNTQENTNLTGRNGRTIGMLKRNKAVKVSGTNGMVSLGLIETEVGKAGESDVVTTVKIPDYIVATKETDGDAIVAYTNYVAVGTAGNEIGELYVKNSNGTIKKTLTQDASVAEGKFTYDPATKKFAFHAGDVAENDEITVYYKRKIKADVVIENVSDNYSEKLELYVDVIAEDKCKNEYRVQFFIPYADFSGNFDIAIGDSQTAHSFEATSLASVCGNGSSVFWKMIVFGANAADVTE